MTGFDGEIIDRLPALRAFARRLCRDAARADDLVQDTLERAYAGRLTYEPRTGMKSWLFTIMRRAHAAAWRRESRFGEPLALDGEALPDGAFPASAACQDGPLMMDDANRLLDALPPEQREAVLLVCVGGRSVGEADALLGVEPGTVKSRVSRARARLTGLAEAGRLARRGGVADHVGCHLSPDAPVSPEGGRGAVPAAARRLPVREALAA